MKEIPESVTRTWKNDETIIKYKDFRYDFSRNYHIQVISSAWKVLPIESEEELEGNTKKSKGDLKHSLMELFKNKDFVHDFSRNYHNLGRSAWKFPLIDYQEELEGNTKKCKRNLKDSMELSKNIKISGTIFQETNISSLPH